MSSRSSSAARTNLTSYRVQLHLDEFVGEGAFRMVYGGTYIGGNRNSQEAVCKCFKSQFAALESEFFSSDFDVAERAIRFAEEWNDICANDETILITRGDIHTIGDETYLVEPLIRNFTKFTSNNGWIADDKGWWGEAMEAFSHFTYHRSGGYLLVCDLQGRYRQNRFANSKNRFELTDIAICSRRVMYGPTDLGEKGIDSFFNNHVCNQFCNINGRWARPRYTRQWFPKMSSTSMIHSSDSYLLALANRSTFQPGFGGILEEEYSDDSY